MQKIISRAILAGFLVGAGACAAFSGADAESSKDGTTPGSGAGGPDGGSSPGSQVVGAAGTGALEVTAPTDMRMLTHGRSEVVKVTVTRKAGFTGPVKVSASNLPEGLTTEALTLGPSDSTGDLKLTVGAAVPQGRLATVVIEATDATGAVKATSPLDAFVRGAPGEVDTTFGAGGVLATAAGQDKLWVAPDDRLYVGGYGFVYRYMSEGALDTTFGNGGKAGGGLPTVVARSEGIFALDENHGTPNATRYDLDGRKDAGFAWKAADPASADRLILAGVAVSPTGHIAAYGGNGDEFRIFWISPTGASELHYSYDRVVGFLTGAVYVSQPQESLVAIGEAHVVRVNAKDGLFAKDFGTNGDFAVESSVTLRDIAVDGQGRFVVSGRDKSTGGLYLARIKPEGAYDDAFRRALAGFAVILGSGAVALQSDAKIVQAGVVDAGGGTKRCTLLRYLEDGRLDVTFGDQGRATLSVECGLSNVGFRSGGRILVGGPNVVSIWP